MTTLLAARSFDTIEREETDLIIVERDVAFAASLRERGLAADRFESPLTVSSAAAVATAACTALAIEVPGLAHDIAEIAERFLTELRQPTASLRLEIVHDMSCPKMHVDSVHVRLITTYLGPGTEYCNAKTPADIRRVRAGDIALLKGRRHPTHAGTVLHRSPATTSVDPRVVLVLDY